VKRTKWLNLNEALVLDPSLWVVVCFFNTHLGGPRQQG